MANCQFCGKVLPNNKPISHRCSICGAVWCPNGTCTGSLGRVQVARTEGSMCQSCRHSGGIKKI